MLLTFWFGPLVGTMVIKSGGPLMAQMQFPLGPRQEGMYRTLLL